MAQQFDRGKIIALMHTYSASRSAVSAVFEKLNAGGSLKDAIHAASVIDSSFARHADRLHRRMSHENVNATVAKASAASKSSAKDEKASTLAVSSECSRRIVDTFRAYRPATPKSSPTSTSPAARITVRPAQAADPVSEQILGAMFGEAAPAQR